MIEIKLYLPIFRVNMLTKFKEQVSEVQSNPKGKSFQPIEYHNWKGKTGKAINKTIEASTSSFMHFWVD